MSKKVTMSRKISQKPDLKSLKFKSQDLGRNITPKIRAMCTLVVYQNSAYCVLMYQI